jgi:hypothetical protein
MTTRLALNSKASKAISLKMRNTDAWLLFAKTWNGTTPSRMWLDMNTLRPAENKTQVLASTGHV